MFFYLSPECMLVTGLQGGAVYNLEKSEMVRLDPDSTRLVGAAELSGEVDGDASVLKELCAMEWGFFSETPLFIDKLRPYHKFLKERLDLNAPEIATAVVQLTNECNLACHDCGVYFCPLCFSQTTPVGIGNELSLDDWMRIFTTLLQAGAKNFLLTGGNPILYKGFDTIIKFLHSQGAHTGISSNGMLPLPDIAGSQHSFVIVARRPEALDTIQASAPSLNSPVTLIVPPDLPEKTLQELHLGTARIRTVSTKMRRINSSKDLSGLRMEAFYRRQDYDDCLHGNIYVTARGDMVPCFQKRELVLGNLLTDPFRPLYRKLIEEHWLKNMRKKEVESKCAHCELYFGCNTCSCFSADTHCAYTPNTGTWSSPVSGNEAPPNI